jgi:hypothetical protein
MSAALKAEFEYYQANQDELVSRYDGKTIVLKNCKVLGEYDSYLAAFTETVKNHKRGTFLIQQVSEGTEAYTATIHTPGVLAG